MRLPKEAVFMTIYDMLKEIESDENESSYGVEPLSYEVLGCGKDD